MDDRNNTPDNQPRTASYAEVSINTPFAGREIFSYAIPSGLTVLPGQAVLVPFGKRLLQGIVVSLTDSPNVDITRVRDIYHVIDSRPLLSPIRLSLARWISDYYLSPLFDAISLMLPPGFQRKTLTIISLASNSAVISNLNEKQISLIKLLQEQKELSIKDLKRKLGKKTTKNTTASLLEAGIIKERYELDVSQTSSKTETLVTLAIAIDEAKKQIEALQKTRKKKIPAVLTFLIEQTSPVSLVSLREKFNCTTRDLNTLIENGSISFIHAPINREPISYDKVVPSIPPYLSGAQKHALDTIRAGFDKTSVSPPNIFLLHGVTGSGKTEVYLQALAEAVKRGKRGIMLVPEIALTPQTVERFASRFGKRVAVLHSQLSHGERYDEWHRIRNGEFDVVVGARSAIFAPQPDLGLIIIDEEYEWTYKQSDISPRYHTRDVALKLAELTHSLVILGTATPDVMSFYQSQRGRYRLLSLPERVSPYHGSPMPHISIIDMREELKAGNRGLISRLLKEAVDNALAKNEQAILFLNRRGTASFVQCRACGYVLHCKNCSMPLTYHAAGERLVCHQCNYRTRVPSTCPKCGSPHISYLGAGTQKLEYEVKQLFPKARLIRWDSDSTIKKNAHQIMAAKVRRHEADIVVGTQMVASGLDFPGVSVVGVVSADFALNLPDFRAGERTFQLLMQVTGRAGRGTPRAEAVIQTYTPENYAVKAASLGDYRAFYEKEIAYRRELVEPPFSRLVALTYSHVNEAACKDEAEKLKKRIVIERDSAGIAGLSIIGPAPCFIPRLRGRYRYQLILRFIGKTDFLSKLSIPRGWSIDVDPVGMG